MNKIWLMMISLTLCVFMACNTDKLSSSESDDLAIFARKVMDDGLKKGAIKSMPQKYVVQTPEGTYFVDYRLDKPVQYTMKNADGTTRNTTMSNRRDRRIYEIAESDMEMMRTEMPHLAHLEWINMDERRGKARYEWVGISGARYAIEFSGPLDDPSHCGFRVIAPQRIDERMVNKIVRRPILDSEYVNPENHRTERVKMGSF